MRRSVTVVMLAGGVGKRFAPFVTDKSLFPFLGEAILLRSVRKLADHGFSRFVIVANSRIEDMVRRFNVTGADITVVVQNDPNGMADAVLVAEQSIRGPMLVVNAEDVVEDSLYERLRIAVDKNESFIVGKTVQEYFDGGYVSASQDRLTGIVEKPGQGKEPSNRINLVFHYFPVGQRFIEHIRGSASNRDDRYEVALARYLKDEPVRVLPYDGFWSPLKYPWHVLSVLEYLLAHDLKPGKGKHVEIRNNVSLEGVVYIGNNVRIYENTKIVGPVYIGDNTVIGNSNIVRASYIGRNCVLGFMTDVARSYIGDDCWFHSNYIGDSVLEGNVSMGAGSVLANLRLDEGEVRSSVGEVRENTKRTKLGSMIAKDVRIGVNASIMPGVKVGANTFIGAGAIVDRDVASDSFCVAQSGVTVKKNSFSAKGSDRSKYKAKI